MLQMHLIDAERLTAIVDRTAARTIGIRQRVTLGQEVPLLIQRTEGFVADLVIEQDELAEVRSGPIIDVHLPARFHLSIWTAPERIQVLRSFRFDDKPSEET